GACCARRGGEGRRPAVLQARILRDSTCFVLLLRKQENEARGITQDALDGEGKDGVPLYSRPASCVIPRASFSCFRSSSSRASSSRAKTSTALKPRRPASTRTVSIRRCSR